MANKRRTRQRLLPAEPALPFIVLETIGMRTSPAGRKLAKVRRKFENAEEPVEDRFSFDFFSGASGPSHSGQLRFHRRALGTDGFTFVTPLDDRTIAVLMDPGGWAASDDLAAGHGRIEQRL